MARAARVPAQAAQAKQDVVRADEPKGGALAAPGFMAGYEGLGTENIDATDVETARIKLLQGLSPEVEQFDQARVGHFWHTMGNLDLGQSLTIVPIYIDKMAILWQPRESGGGILARSVDLTHWVPSSGEAAVKINKGTKSVTWKWIESVPASGLLEWGSSDPQDKNSQPAATLMYNIVVAMPGFPGVPPAVVTLQRSSVRAAKKFLGQLTMVKAPIFGCKFSMTSVDERNANAQGYKGFQFNPVGLVQEEREFLAYKELHEQYKRLGLKIKDLEGLAEEGDAAASGDVPVDKDRPKY